MLGKVGYFAIFSVYPRINTSHQKLWIHSTRETKSVIETAYFQSIRFFSQNASFTVTGGAHSPIIFFPPMIIHQIIFNIKIFNP